MDVIIHPFPNFNGGTVDDWEWMNNSNTHNLQGICILIHAGIKVNPYK